MRIDCIHTGAWVFAHQAPTFILCRIRAASAIFSHSSQIFQPDRSFTSVVPPWKNGRHAFSIGTPPECVSENPRSDCFWVRPPVLAKGSREISLMTAVDPFNHRFAWAAKGFRSSTGLTCLKLNNIAIENNPSRMIVSRKNFSSNTCGFKGWCSKLLFFYLKKLE